jgi:hypothetical protein
MTLKVIGAGLRAALRDFVPVRPEELSFGPSLDKGERKGLSLHRKLTR